MTTGKQNTVSLRQVSAVSKQGVQKGVLTVLNPLKGSNQKKPGERVPYSVGSGAGVRRGTGWGAGGGGGVPGYGGWVPGTGNGVLHHPPVLYPAPTVPGTHCTHHPVPGFHEGPLLYTVLAIGTPFGPFFGHLFDPFLDPFLDCFRPDSPLF